MYKFIYRVDQWWIIISESSHFYYNHEDGSKSWCLPAGLDINRVNFDHLAYLFARARGLDVQEMEQQKEQQKEQQEQQQERGSGSEGEMGQLESEPQSESEPEEERAQQPVKGLDLGYSSSESEPEGEEGEDPEDDESDTPDAESVDNLVNQLLNAGAESDSDDATGTNTDANEFQSVLNDLRPQINVYDPYAIVEEDLINELIKYPIFYKLKFNEKQAIFNEWAQSHTGHDTPKFPTPKQLYLNQLFELKAQVKTGHFVDLKSKVTGDFTDKQMVFLKYKNMLLEQTKYEKTNKSKFPNENLKKRRLSEFLNKFPLNKKGYQVHGTDDFEKWINMCNDLDLPEELVEDERNWIVGDTKRLECYLEAITP